MKSVHNPNETIFIIIIFGKRERKVVNVKQWKMVNSFVTRMGHEN